MCLQNTEIPTLKRVRVQATQIASPLRCKRKLKRDASPHPRSVPDSWLLVSESHLNDVIMPTVVGTTLLMELKSSTKIDSDDKPLTVVGMDPDSWLLSVINSLLANTQSNRVSGMTPQRHST